VWACSHKDAEQLQQLYQPRAPVAVVPNGINPTDYENTQAVSARDDWSGHALTVSFLGSYSYLPNEDAALQLIREVMPALRSAAADPRLLLIGREPTPALRQAAAGDARITITGAVDSILPYLASPSVVTLPISCGSGTRLKILEAFAAGRPVVSTAKGAEGLEVVDGRHLLVRDHPADIAAAVLEVWRDPARRSQLVERSRQLVEDQYSWAACAAKIARSLEPVMSGVVHPVAAGVTAP
jgi:polysaccharide biosynthesis protein PslH